MTEWEVHEAILEDIEAKGFPAPDRITIPYTATSKIPAGDYERDENEVWRRIGEPSAPFSG